MDFGYEAISVSSGFRIEVGLQFQFGDYAKKLCDFFLTVFVVKRDR